MENKRPCEEENINKIGTTFELSDGSGKPKDQFDGYDKMARIMIVKTLFNNHNKTKVLDAGCSIGAWGSILKQEGCSEVYGADISAERLKVAEKRGAYTQLVCGNLANLPFKNEFFNVILCNDVLVHVLQTRQRDLVLKELRRVLKRDGFLIVSFANKLYARNPQAYCRFDTKTSAEEFLTDAGFEIERTIGHCFGFVNPPFLYFLPVWDALFGGVMPQLARVFYFKVKRRVI